jgi:hypothetical protein
MYAFDHRLVFAGVMVERSDGVINHLIVVAFTGSLLGFN